MSVVGNSNYQVIISQESGDTVVAYLPENFSYDATSTFSQPFAQGLLGGGMAATVASVFGYRIATQAMTAELWQGCSSSDLQLSLDFFAEDNTVMDVRNNVIALAKMATPGLSDMGFLTAPGPQLDSDSTRQILADTGTSIADVLQKNDWPGQKTVKYLADLIAPGVTPDPTKGNNMKDPTQANNASANSKAVTQIGILKKNIKKQVSVRLGNYAFFDSVVITNVQKTWEHMNDANGQPTHVKVNLTFRPLFTITQNDLENIFLKG